MDNNFNQISNFGTIFDRYMMPLNSPITQPKSLSGYNFEYQNEMQGRFMRASLVNIKNFIQSSSVAVATGTFGNGQVLNLTTTLTPNPPHQFDQNFGDPYVSIYLGSYTSSFPGTAQIYPANGAGVTAGNFKTQGDLDFHTYTGTNSSWSGIIINNSGATGTITFVTKWKFIQYNSTTQT